MDNIELKITRDRLGMRIMEDGRRVYEFYDAVAFLQGPMAQAMLECYARPGKDSQMKLAAELTQHIDRAFEPSNVISVPPPTDPEFAGLIESLLARPRDQSQSMDFSPEIRKFLESTNIEPELLEPKPSPGKFDKLWRFNDPDLSDVFLNHDAKVPFCVDDEACNGVLDMLSKHLVVWKEPCIIRLSDILKKTSTFLDKRPQIQYRMYNHLQPIEKDGRYYKVPDDHSDEPNCCCKLCLACQETVKLIDSIGFTPVYLAELIIQKICGRTRDFLVSHIKLIFQEADSDPHLDDFICSGFQYALPVVGCVDFEHLFKQMYNVGSHIVWEITKRLSLFVKYSSSYTGSLNFVCFFIDVFYRLASLLPRLAKELAFFEWKLDLDYKLNLKTFFVNIFDSLLYRSHEFQEILATCTELVFKSRKHPSFKLGSEMSTWAIKTSLNHIREATLAARNLWSSKKFHFKFEEYVPPTHNIFKISQLQNPFEKVKPNRSFGYEAVLSRVSGQIEYQSLGPNIRQATRFDPVLDITMKIPRKKNHHFAIRVYRAPLKVNFEQMDNMLKAKDAIFINSHDYNVTLKAENTNFFESQYATERQQLGLGEVEPPLPSHLEKMFSDHYFNLEHNFFQNSPKVTRRNAPSGFKRIQVDLCWPPATYTRMHRFSPEVRLKKRRRLLKVLSRCTPNSLVMKSQLPPHREYRRFDYAFGGIPELTTEAGMRVSDAKNFQFEQEIVASAIQLGCSSLSADIKGGHGRYFVVCTSLDATFEEPPRHKFVPSSDDIGDIIKLHYDVLSKHNVIWYEISAKSPNCIERNWAVEAKVTPVESRIKDRMEQMKLEKRKRPLRAKEIIPEHNERIFTDNERKGPEELLKTAAKAEDLLGYATRTVGDGIFETRAQYVSHSHTGDSASVSEGFEHARTHTHIQCHGNGVCHSSSSQSAKPGRCAEHDKKASRPGLPVSAGYNERRNTLRQKLAREKKEKEDVDFACENCGNPHCAAAQGAARRSSNASKSDEVVRKTSLNAEQDIDALVDIIEGVKNVGVSDQHRNSSASESNDVKKAAKKARKKEKKEQRRQEEELARKEREVQEFMEKAKALELEKQKNKDAKADADGRASMSQGAKRIELSKIEKSEVTKTDFKKNEAKKAEEKKPDTKKIEENKNDKKGDSKKNEDKKAEESKAKPADKKTDDPKSEMVTIRRHATAPDTTVTISVKSDNGEEDVLYTLVNGQVVKAEGKKTDNNKSNGSQPSSSSAKQGTKGGATEKKETGTKTTAKQDEKVQTKNTNKTDGAKETAVPAGKKKASNSNNQTSVQQSKPSVLTTSKKSVDSEEVQKPMTADQKEYFMLQDESGNDVDISKVKLPPGITITKINAAGETISSNGSGTVLVVGNPPKRSDKREYQRRDFDTVDDLYFTSRDTGAFEEVVSNKTRRQRNRENKGRDGTDTDDHQDNTSVGKRWGSEYSSSESFGEAPKPAASVNQASRGKRPIESHVGESMTFENSRYRKNSGSTSGPRSQNMNTVKHNAAKQHNQYNAGAVAKHTQQQSVASNPPPVQAQPRPPRLASRSPQSYAPTSTYSGDFQTPTSIPMPSLVKGFSGQPFLTESQLQNGRSPRLTPASTCNIPRLNRMEEPLVRPVPKQNPPTIVSEATHAPFMTARVSGPSTEYFQQFGAQQGPAPVPEPQVVGFPNGQLGQQNYGNMDMGSGTGFQEYNPWGPNSGAHNANFLGELLKELNITEGQESQVGISYANYPSSDSFKPWVSSPYSGHQQPMRPSDHQYEGVSVPVFTSAPTMMASPSPIGSNRPQSCDLGIGFARSFGDNSSTSTSVAVQRPSASPGVGAGRNQFTHAPGPTGFQFYDRGPYENQNTEATSNAQNYVRPNDAEYSLF